MKKFITNLICALFLICFLGLNINAQTVDFIAPEPECLKVVDLQTDVYETDPLTFTANVTGGTVDQYVWDFDDGSDTETGQEVTHVYSRAGEFSVTLEVTFDDGTMKEISKKVTVKALPNVVFNFHDDELKKACQGEKILLNADFDRYNAAILWSLPGQDAKQIYIDEATYAAQATYNIGDIIPIKAVVYTLGTDGPPCKVERDVKVQIIPLPNIWVEQDEFEIFIGESVQLKAFGAANYSWTPAETLDDPDSQYPWATPEESIVYTVVGETVEGCAGSATVEVNVDVEIGNESSPVVATNVIVPNSTAENEFWVIEHPEWYQQCKLIIYNRWGQEVYNRDQLGNSPNVWDGKDNNGNYLPDDTYYYIIQCENCNDAEHCPNVKNTHTGSITIIRKK